jgi:hypothetical protein
MENLSESLTFTVPITLAAHAQAQTFIKKHRNSLKAKQVYLNTLAVFAVNFYLCCMGIETSWETSLSYDSLMQALLDVADLEIVGVGKIECVPVLPKEKFICVSPEASTDRIGYVAVQFDECLEQATLLGFAKTVPECGELCLRELSSLESLLLYLSQDAQEVSKPINLNLWLINRFDAGWEAVEKLLSLQQQAELAFKFRSPEHSLIEASNVGVQKGKVLDLGRDSKSIPIALVLGVMPVSSNEINIYVRVCPIGTENYLPEELEIKVLDEREIAVMQATARKTKSIQLNFSSEVGERFSVRVGLGDFYLTETFIA